MLFFDRKPGREEPWTKKRWVYDFRTNEHFTLKQNPLTRAEGFAPEVLAAVDALTRREGENYFDFCRRAGRDPVARVVKLADIDDNLDLGRIADPTAADHARVERYRKARALLLG